MADSFCPILPILCNSRAIELNVDTAKPAFS